MATYSVQPQFSKPAFGYTEEEGEEEEVSPMAASESTEPTLPPFSPSATQRKKNGRCLPWQPQSLNSQRSLLLMLELTSTATALFRVFSATQRKKTGQTNQAGP
jgi:hypothetical protein